MRQIGFVPVHRYINCLMFILQRFCLFIIDISFEMMKLLLKNSIPSYNTFISKIIRMLIFQYFFYKDHCLI